MKILMIGLIALGSIPSFANGLECNKVVSENYLAKAIVEFKKSSNENVDKGIDFMCLAVRSCSSKQYLAYEMNYPCHFKPVVEGLEQNEFKRLRKAVIKDAKRGISILNTSQCNIKVNSEHFSKSDEISGVSISRCKEEGKMLAESISFDGVVKLTLYHVDEHGQATHL